MDYPVQYSESDPALKKRKPTDPLADYFGGSAQPQPPTAAKPPPAPATAAQQAPLPQAPPATNVGQQAAQPVPQPVATPMAPAPVQLPRPKAVQGPTNFVNFQRYFNANKGAAERTAADVGHQVQQRNEDAAAALQKTQDDFNAKVAAGTVQAPGDAEYLNAEQLARAAAGYTGPAGLNEAAGYDDAVAASQRAQQGNAALKDDAGLAALIGGPHAGFDAALAGAAGRSNLDALRARFNPGKAGETADAEAAKQVEAAQAKSGANSERWAAAATTEQKRQADEASAEAARVKAADDQAKQLADWSKNPPPYEARNDPTWGIDRNNKKAMQAANDQYRQFIEAQHKDFGDDLRDVVRDFSLFDRVWNAATGGKKSPLDAEGSKFNADVHKNDKNVQTGLAGGNKSGGKGEHIPWSADDFIVFRQMDDAQWAELQSRGKQGQVDWINTRRNQLAPQWKGRHS